MTIDSRIAAVVFALLAMPAFAQSTQLADPASQNCVTKGGTLKMETNGSGGKSVDATFVNGAQSSVRLEFSDGRSLTLPQAMSGLGARYANNDESFVFRNEARPPSSRKTARRRATGAPQNPE